jgi:hypothetical protein
MCELFGTAFTLSCLICLLYFWYSRETVTRKTFYSTRFIGVVRENEWILTKTNWTHFCISWNTRTHANSERRLIYVYVCIHIRRDCGLHEIFEKDCDWIFMHAKLLNEFSRNKIRFSYPILVKTQTVAWFILIKKLDPSVMTAPYIYRGTRVWWWLINSSWITLSAHDWNR